MYAPLAYRVAVVPTLGAGHWLRKGRQCQGDGQGEAHRHEDHEADNGTK
jgi:hypothetical protein